MLVRIFGDAPDPDEWTAWEAKLVQSLCQLADRSCTVELCDPMTWGSHPRPADIHIYLTEPSRMAVPWAACNVALVSRAWWGPEGFGAAWLPWAATEIDLFVVRGAEPVVAGLPADRVFVLREAARGVTSSPLRAFADSWRRLMTTIESKRHAPALPAPPLSRGAEVPRVGVITLTRNRPQWWPVMLRNVAGARWPLNRLEWIIVDDSDAGKGLDDQVAKVSATTALTIRYVRLTPTSPLSIGAKRNAAVEAASADVNLFVCMDDDDHYPEDSIGRRISWIGDARKGTGAAYCATIPMYDTTRYISAVNTPPMTIGVAQRVSEATLAFTREFWTARPFPDVSMAEGEGFLAGRETQTAEIPPYGVIVSFIHGRNTSSRRIPADQPANGCHYGFSDEFFRLVHETALIR
jgi:hypothetical protein